MPMPMEEPGAVRPRQGFGFGIPLQRRQSINYDNVVSINEQMAELEDTSYRIPPPQPRKDRRRFGFVPDRPAWSKFFG